MLVLGKKKGVHIRELVTVAMVTTTVNFRLVLCNGPSFFRDNENRHDTSVMPVMKLFRYFFFKVCI